jgi:hypothetical protein
MLISGKTYLIHQISHEIYPEPPDLQSVQIIAVTWNFGWRNTIRIEWQSVIDHRYRESLGVDTPGYANLADILTAVSVFDDICACFIAGELDSEQFIDAESSLLSASDHEGAGIADAF